jgi:serine/threonine protein kinase
MMKYELLGRLGRGATGVVYEAENRVTRRRVAVKILDPVAASSGAEHVIREARAAGQLESRHIAQVLDAGTEDDRPYIVLELLRGADLATVLSNLGRLDTNVALKLVGQACAGLAKAHAAGILHRDIKPANLFVAQEDDQLIVKLLDFGLAKAMTPGALGDIGRQTLTSERTLVGTPLYMSPEQARGAKTIDGRSDLWSLGVVLYEALTGGTPFEEEATSLADVIIAICMKQARIARHAPGLPRNVEVLVDKTLDLDASHRFQTAAEMSEAIRSIVGSFAIDVSELDGSFFSSSSRRESDARMGDGCDGETVAVDSNSDALRVRTLTLASSQVIVETSVREHYVLANVRGRMSTSADAQRSNDFLAEALEAAGLRSLLLDARRADGTKEGHASLWAWIRAHQAFDRMAILVESPALMRGFNVQAAECGLHQSCARAFDDLAAAEAWLQDEGTT